METWSVTGEQPTPYLLYLTGKHHILLVASIDFNILAGGPWGTSSFWGDSLVFCPLISRRHVMPVPLCLVTMLPWVDTAWCQENIWLAKAESSPGSGAQQRPKTTFTNEQVFKGILQLLECLCVKLRVVWLKTRWTRFSDWWCLPKVQWLHALIWKIIMFQTNILNSCTSSTHHTVFMVMCFSMFMKVLKVSSDRL